MDPELEEAWARPAKAENSSKTTIAWLRSAVQNAVRNGQLNLLHKYQAYPDDLQGIPRKFNRPLISYPRPPVATRLGTPVQ